MKVYSVWIWDYGELATAGNNLRGIYATRELAEMVRDSFLNREKQFLFDYVVITEEEVLTAEDLKYD